MGHQTLSQFHLRFLFDFFTAVEKSLTKAWLYLLVMTVDDLFSTKNKNMGLKRKRTHEKQVDAEPEVIELSFEPNNIFTRSTTSSAVSLMEAQVLTAAMLPIKNESRQHFLETLRQQQSAYARAYECKPRH